MNERARLSTWIVIGAFALLAIAAGFFAREPLERAFFLHAVDAATGIAFDADSVERSGDGYELTDLRASTRGGSALVAAPRAYVALDGRHLTVSLRDPSFVFDPDRYRSVRGAFGDASLDLRVSGGSLTVVTGEVPEPKLDFDAIDGSLHASAAGLAYDVTLALQAGGVAYPISGHSALRPDGSPAQAWSAPLLPLAPFADLIGTPDVRVRAGELVDLTVDDGATLRASGRLADVDVALGAHELRGVHGLVQLDGGGIGSRGLAGSLDDGVPIDFAGEVHDLRGRYAWLRDGSADLSGIADVVAVIANEPRLRAVHVEATAPGLAYAQFASTGDHGPLAVSLLAVEPREPTLRFDTAIAQDHVISGGERTSAMGVRTGAVAGVNGDYFDIGRTYQPQGLLVRSGALLRGPTDRAALAIDKDGHVTFDEFHLVGTVDLEGRRLAVTQLNNWPAGGENVTVITPGFGKTLPAAPGVTFVPLDPLGGERFRVRAVEPAVAPLPVEFGLAFGPDARVALRPGESVRLSYRLDPPVPGAVAAIGGGPILIKDGEWYDDPDAPAPDERDYRWPVVALARKADDRLLLVAVDGRHPERSVGMTRPEFGDLLLRLGAVDAMALDSGGSVTLVSRAPGDTNVSVRNVPSDNSAERWVSDALFLYSTAPAPNIVPALGAATPAPEARPTP